MRRYDQLKTLFRIIKPSSFAEIGVWRGDRAIDYAESMQRPCKYIGFDVFEDGDDSLDKKEFNVKKHYTKEDIEKRLSENRDLAFELHKGNTRDRTEPIVARMIFIDGGHSVETIRHDYGLCEADVVVFDDYYVADENGKCPDISKVGCNQLVTEIGAGVLPAADRVADGGLVKFAIYPSFWTSCFEDVK